MPGQLLATKFFFPKSHHNLVARPRLVQRLQEGLDGPLTLVSAPAGYGKTTLLSEWRSTAGKDKLAGWLALDPADNDPRRFWLYLTAALNSISPALVPETASQLSATSLPPQETLLEGMLNELSCFQQDFVLVLDDWHVITALPLLEILAFLVAHSPPQVHLVILSRADPPLPLARLRAGKSLVEIRAEHLRFTHNEATDFMRQVMGLDLSSADIQALESRCEGWIASLQMVALSIQGRNADQCSDFITAFTGSHHYIVDYLAEEVLCCHSEEMRTFLLETSILERMKGELCNALTGRTNGQGALEELDRANQFVVPLDERQGWYRYHPLFHDFLRKSFQQQAPPAHWLEVHRQASRWYAENGMLEEAVQFALTAHDFDYAADLIFQFTMKATGREDVALLLRWLKPLPPEMVYSHPSLCLNYAMALTYGGYMDEVEPLLQQLEGVLFEADQDPEFKLYKILEQARDPIIRQITGGLSVRSRFPIQINFLRIAIERYRDLEKAKALCYRTFELVPPDDTIDTCGTNFYLGHILLQEGNTAQAVQILSEAARESYKINNAALHVSCVNYLGQGLLLQGRLREAMNIFQESSRYVARQPEPILAGVDLIRLGDVQREWNDLPAASANIREGLSQAELGGDFVFRREGYIAQANLDRALGDLDAAELHLKYAEEAAHQTETSRGIMPILPLRARLWIARGDLQAARRWALGSGLESGSRAFMDEYGRLTLARLHLAQVRFVEAQDLLENILQSAEAAGRTGRVIETLLLQALAFHGQGNSSRALEALTRSLSLAEPQGYVRLFLDEGAPLVRLLAMLARQRPGSLRDYLNLLLSSAGPFIEEGTPTAHPQKAAPMPLIEPLSERELEVLRLIADGCSNQEIARRLFIAIGTVKRHTVNIFGKLGVANRTQAVSRGRELHLLD